MKNTHCSFCGQAFRSDQPWPRTCSRCGNLSFQNPVPVCVILVPIEAGLLAVRRAIPPHIGMLALPGGYINLGETWQQAGAREVLEETGLAISTAEIRPFDVHSAPDGTLLVFGLARPRQRQDLPASYTDSESSETLVLTDPSQLAFYLHAEVARRYFLERESLILPQG